MTIPLRLLSLIFLFGSVAAPTLLADESGANTQSGEPQSGEPRPTLTLLQAVILGFVEGASGSVKSTFDNTQRVVRYWREEKTADGRIILVPENFLVDENGRVIRKVQ